LTDIFLDRSHLDQQAFKCTTGGSTFPYQMMCDFVYLH